MKKIVYIDLDDTTFDFKGSEAFNGQPLNEYLVHKMYEPGFFFNLKPVKGALRSIRAIMRLGFEVHFLTKPVAESAHSYSEKAQSVALWFPELIRNLHMTQNKGLFKGDYLIDDNEKEWKNAFEANGGRFLTFDPKDSEKSWADIISILEWEKLNEK